MDEKIAKLQVATDEAALQLEFSKNTLDIAEADLSRAKEKYRVLSATEQKDLQVNDTELPELIETHVRAKNVYETVEARYKTNKRYLDMMLQKKGSTSNISINETTTTTG